MYVFTDDNVLVLLSWLEFKKLFVFQRFPLFKTVDAGLLYKMYKRGCEESGHHSSCSPSISQRGFHTVTLSFEPHNSVWNSLCSIVNYRTGSPFGTPKILGGL